MLVATWNINGVKARLETLLAWLGERQPDIVGLQEIKSVDEGFPRAEIEAAGYHVETAGQKGFNGVALLSRLPPREVRRGLPGDASDEQARYIEGVWPFGGRTLRVASLYLPNGNPIGTEKFDYKLRWMARLETHAQALLADEEPFALVGDYNVIPMPEDIRRPETMLGDALFQPESRAAFRRLAALGLTDAIRACSDASDLYTFWDYQDGAWRKNHGFRIDHAMLSPEAARHLRSAGIDSHVRAWEKPSDHVPVVVDLAG
ncbi:exodeoxyribonuclease III [Aureimonas endophytica]|uniref:Exodeoxyribonuclease III n=1 Tax=Aureimonas endophytica TaxID=2027858 RepID=A0A916ZD51_9HYPH|nr:exodeoxyribonuclease III [Aureimonas endophytica]GGD87073.1 exodeoxyribonuclease III [Aureimonas endophytica]